MNQTVEKERLRRRKQNQRRARTKRFFMVLGVLVVALAAFLITVKICKPDFDFSLLVPDKAVTFVQENVLGRTTTAPTTQAPTAPPTTEKPTYADYKDASAFAFDTSKQGSQVGNILNKTQGAVTFNGAYIYFAAPGQGIYRFAPAEETTTKVKGVKNACCLNIMGDFLYYIDKDSKKLQKLSVSGGDAVTLLPDARRAYGYNDRLFCLTGDSLYTVTAAGDKTLLYTAGADKKLALVGISLTDVYFTETDNLTGEVEYLTVGQTGGNSTHFRAATEKDEVRSMALENGYFYYYQRRSENKYDLVRQKFGSQKTVTLLEHVRFTDYPVVYGNRLYYTDYKSGAAQAMELNMNSGAKKVMLTASGADKSGTVAVACGYQYIFLIGKKTESGGSVYRASCIYTSASADNTMDFRSGKWSY